MARKAFEVQLADGTTIKMQARSYQERPASRWAKTRVYVGNVVANTPALRDVELPAPKLRGEDPANDKAYADYNRAYVRAARSLVTAALAELVKLGRVHEDELAGMSWSAKAGCSCPCSPGFKLAHTVTVELEPCDIWVTFPKGEGEPTA